MKSKHIFGAASPPKVVPTTNQFSIKFSEIKCSKYNTFFHPRYKRTLNWFRFAVGPLFGVRPRRRCVRFHDFVLQNARKYILVKDFQSLGSVLATVRFGRGKWYICHAGIIYWTGYSFVLSPRRRTNQRPRHFPNPLSVLKKNQAEINALLFWSPLPKRWSHPARAGRCGHQKAKGKTFVLMQTN